MLILESVWKDNNDKKAYLTLFLDSEQTLVSAASAASNVLDAVQAASNAVIVGARLRIPVAFSRPFPVPFEGNAYERAIILFTDGAESYSVSIASPDRLPYDVVGDYRDIRVSGAGLLLPTVQTINDTLRDYTLTREGNPIPGNIVVIGRTKNQP